MNLSVITTSSLSVFGGQERVLVTVVKNLKSKYGCHLSLISLPPSSGKLRLPPSEEFSDVHIWRGSSYLTIWGAVLHGLVKKLLHMPVLFNRPILEKCFSILQSSQVVLVTSPFLLSSVSDLITKHGSNCSIVYWDHGWLAYYHRSDLTLYRLVRRVLFHKELIRGIKLADAHLAISSGIAEIIKRIHPEAKVYLVYNPVPRYDGPIIQRPRKPIFLYVGRISNGDKNISFMLKGLSRLKHKDWQLKIVGTGPDEKKLKKLAGKLGIADRISWLGFRKDPYSEFQEITALLLTSRYEGFGMVLVEANQRGIPVISSDCESGPKDIVITGVNGYLYREGDMDEFVRIVSDVIDGRLSFDTPENIAKTAERFREDVVAENIYRALKQMCDASKTF